MSHFFENILSKYQCGFRKGFSTQHCLLAMLEKWKRSVDNDKAFGALQTDLSKAFDCLDHELLIAKLNAYRLTFDDHTSELCKKASRKIHALARVTPYMNMAKKRILMNAFFKSQFSYCPLVWMCHSHANNSKINRLHERCLRIIYSDK